jgi:hypothetical protein
MERKAGPPHRDTRFIRDILEAGTFAGVLAGLGMAVWLATFGLFTGLGGLTPLKLIGGTLYRHSALEEGMGPAFWGLVLHLAVAAAFGVLYAAIMASRRQDPLAEVAGAIVYGLLVWIVMTFAVLPLVDPFMRSRVTGFSTAWFGAHVVYGATLGILPQVRRALPQLRRGEARG